VRLLRLFAIGPSQRDILEEPYGFMNTISQENSSYVNITTPPRVLTVEERFPVVQDESLDTTGQEMGSQMRLVLLSQPG